MKPSWCRLGVKCDPADVVVANGISAGQLLQAKLAWNSGRCNHIRKKSTFLICRMSLVSPDLPKMSLSLLVSIGESSTSNWFSRISRMCDILRASSKIKFIQDPSCISHNPIPKFFSTFWIGIVYFYADCTSRNVWLDILRMKIVDPNRLVEPRILCNTHASCSD